MDELLIGQSSPDVAFRKHTNYPWRSLNVGTSFFVARDKVKFTTLAALASRTGKRYGRKYTVRTHEKHEGFSNGCYEVACVKLTVNPTLNNFEAEKLKYLSPAPPEVVNDPVAYANWQIQAKNAKLMDDLQHGRLERQSHVEVEPAEPKEKKPRKPKTEGSDEEFSDAEFEKIKQLPWNRVDEEKILEAAQENFKRSAEYFDRQELEAKKNDAFRAGKQWTTEFIAQPIKNEE